MIVTLFFLILTALGQTYTPYIFCVFIDTHVVISYMPLSVPGWQGYERTSFPFVSSNHIFISTQ